jgi:hypothetical protein
MKPVSSQRERTWASGGGGLLLAAAAHRILNRAAWHCLRAALILQELPRSTGVNDDIRQHAYLKQDKQDGESRPLEPSGRFCFQNPLMPFFELPQFATGELECSGGVSIVKASAYSI